jgi:hypothetical protein
VAGAVLMLLPLRRGVVLTLLSAAAIGVIIALAAGTVSPRPQRGQDEWIAQCLPGAPLAPAQQRHDHQRRRDLLETRAQLFRGGVAGLRPEL